MGSVECKHCGGCCSNLLPLSQSEIVSIKRYMKIYTVKECKHSFPASKKMAMLTCPFLDTSKAENKCTIYPVRPMICKAFYCNKHTPDKRLLGEARKTVVMRDEFFKGGKK